MQGIFWRTFGMLTDAHLDLPRRLPLALAKGRNMNIRSSELRFRVTFATFACPLRQKAGRAEYLFGEKAFRCEPRANFGPYICLQLQSFQAQNKKQGGMFQPSNPLSMRLKWGSRKSFTFARNW